MHPIAFAAWFGLLANGAQLSSRSRQLDGGHIACHVRPARATRIMHAGAGDGAVGAVHHSTSWYRLDRAHHRDALHRWRDSIRPCSTRSTPLDPARQWLALFALIMFVLCFTPAPIEPLELSRAPALARLPVLGAEW
mgnify:CR=1 FL=1